MTHLHWHVSSNYGLLSSIKPKTLWVMLDKLLPPSLLPILQAVNAGQPLQAILADYPLTAISTDDLSAITWGDYTESQLEIMFMFYGYLACAWVGMGNQQVPASVSLVLAQLGDILDRPPMLGYAGMVLNNWQLKDKSEGFTPQNIALFLHFTDLIDESWFFRVHIAIEAQAGQMLRALIDVQDPIIEKDEQAVLVYLREMNRGLVQITKTFHQMPELCDPDVYYQQIRPFLMSFDDKIIFEARKREFFENNSEKNRKKRKSAIKRNQKEQLKNQKKKQLY